MKLAYGYVGTGVVPVRDVEGLNGWRCGAGARIWPPPWGLPVEQDKVPM